MNVKLINSKLDFLENLIVEMNPVNLEELKKLCFEVISEVSWEVKVFEEAMEISKRYPFSLDATVLLVRATGKLKEKGFDIKLMDLAVNNKNEAIMFSNVLNEDLDPQRFDKNYSASRSAIKNCGFLLKSSSCGLTTTESFEFEKPKVIYDKPESKYFSKPKNNFKKR